MRNFGGGMDGEKCKVEKVLILTSLQPLENSLESEAEQDTQLYKYPNHNCTDILSRMRGWKKLQGTTDKQSHQKHHCVNEMVAAFFLWKIYSEKVN